jgi:hypothetical protein
VVKFVDAVNQSEEALQNFLRGDIPIKFDWANRWLKGDEYAHILSRIDEYCEAFSLLKYSPKTHPESIYLQPQSKLPFDKVQMVSSISFGALQSARTSASLDSPIRRNINGRSKNAFWLKPSRMLITEFLTLALGKK